METRTLRLRDLSFRHCEGYYSKSAHACTWPCSITQMDPTDQLDRVYEAVVFWADVIIVAMPIRWGVASSLYFKMAERFNCVQNQITLRDRIMLRNKVASFIITGGQDNVQGVAGQALTFFSELGCQFPQFPYIAHSRGWSAEDMENNVAYVRNSEHLHEASRDLVMRGCALSKRLLETSEAPPMVRAGRKASGGAGPVRLPIVSDDCGPADDARSLARPSARALRVVARWPPGGCWSGVSPPFGTPTPVAELSTPTCEFPTWVSADGCQILLTSNRPGGLGLNDIWLAPRPL